MYPQHYGQGENYPMHASKFGDLPPWVRSCSSEGLLFFVAPLLGWLFLSVAFYFLTPDSKSFKLACSFLWVGCATAAITTHLYNIILGSVARDLLGQQISLRQPFSYFYLLYTNLSTLQRQVVLFLGLGKVALLLFGAFALWGGLFVIALWLPTING